MNTLKAVAAGLFGLAWAVILVGVADYVSAW